MNKRLRKKYPELNELANIDDGYRLRIEKATAIRIIAGDGDNTNLANDVSIDVFGPSAECEIDIVSKVVSSFIKRKAQLENSIGREETQKRLEQFALNAKELDMNVGKRISIANKPRFF